MKKGSVAWKYIVGSILALIGLGIILWIISRSSSSVSELFSKIFNMF